MAYETLTPSMNASPANAMQKNTVPAWPSKATIKGETSMGNLFQNNTGKSDRKEIHQNARRPMKA